jgi:AraC-like DNA-binding protein
LPGGDKSALDEIMVNTDIIRAGALWGYCQLTRFLAHDPHPLLAEVGLSENDLDDPDQFVPRPAVAALLDRSAERLDCSDFGLRLAGLQDVNILGALAFAIRNAPDFRSAIATAVKHVHYHSPAATLSIEPCDNPGEERLAFRYAGAQSAAASAQMTEQAIGLFCRVDRQLTGDHYRPTRITFAHAPVSSSDVYAEHLGLAPEFGAPVASICIDRRELSTPLRTANPQLQAICERYIELNTPEAGPDTRRRVHQAVSQIMRHGNASIEDVSSMLHMHPRTLQRRLMSEGATFEKVRDDVRRHMAEAYLANELVPLAHVAHLLGYANQSVLTRSCLRWFGRTPLAMRQQVARSR